MFLGKNHVKLQVNCRSGTGLLPLPKAVRLALGYEPGTVFDGPFITEGKITYIPRVRK